MIARRGFLGAILAAGVAPAAVGSGILMPVRRLIVPPWIGVDLGVGDFTGWLIVHPDVAIEAGRLVGKTEAYAAMLRNGCVGQIDAGYRFIVSGKL